MLGDLFRALPSSATEWVQMDAARVQAFADTTEDWQFIHLDADRAAAETPFGGAVCHGFLTLSMLSMMSYQVVPDLPDKTISVNYGFDRVRFVTPVPVGVRIRGQFQVADVTETPQHVAVRWDVSIEIENQSRPALVAQWLTRIYSDA